mmetsp:Transcript_12763/g.38480  ORF Transcript_12763/g.38480 Transcript_12763/m.38480 type:complete len:1180 (+) Transcript_12763:2688-6227(+)
MARAYGSHVSGLDTHLSDLDVVITGVIAPHMFYRGDGTTRVMSNTYLTQFKAHLLAIGAYRHCVHIHKARMPILKLITKSGVSVDVSMADNSGPVASTYLADQVREWDSLRPLVLVLKMQLRAAGLADASAGGLSTWSLALMAISHLRMSFKEGALVSDAGSTLLSFLRRYGYGFDVATQAIAPNREGLVLKTDIPCLQPRLAAAKAAGKGSDAEQMMAARLVIEDPLTRTEVAGGTNRVESLLRLFAEGADVLERTGSLSALFDTTVALRRVRATLYPQQLKKPIRPTRSHPPGATGFPRRDGQARFRQDGTEQGTPARLDPVVPQRTGVQREMPPTKVRAPMSAPIGGNASARAKLTEAETDAVEKADAKLAAAAREAREARKRRLYSDAIDEEYTADEVYEALIEAELSGKPGQWQRFVRRSAVQIPSDAAWLTQQPRPPHEPSPHGGRAPSDPALGCRPAQGAREVQRDQKISSKKSSVQLPAARTAVTRSGAVQSTRGGEKRVGRIITQRPYPSVPVPASPQWVSAKDIAVQRSYPSVPALPRHVPAQDAARLPPAEQGAQQPQTGRDAQPQPQQAPPPVLADSEPQMLRQSEPPRQQQPLSPRQLPDAQPQPQPQTRPPQLLRPQPRQRQHPQSQVPPQPRSQPQALLQRPQRQPQTQPQSQPPQLPAQLPQAQPRPQSRQSQQTVKPHPLPQQPHSEQSWANRTSTQVPLQQRSHSIPPDVRPPLDAGPQRSTQPQRTLERASAEEPFQQRSRSSRITWVPQLDAGTRQSTLLHRIMPHRKRPSVQPAPLASVTPRLRSLDGLRLPASDRQRPRVFYGYHNPLLKARSTEKGIGRFAWRKPRVYGNRGRQAGATLTSDETGRLDPSSFVSSLLTKGIEPHLRGDDALKSNDADRPSDSSPSVSSASVSSASVCSLSDSSPSLSGEPTGTGSSGLTRSRAEADRLPHSRTPAGGITHSLTGDPAAHSTKGKWHGKSGFDTGTATDTSGIISTTPHSAPLTGTSRDSLAGRVPHPRVPARKKSKSSRKKGTPPPPVDASVNKHGGEGGRSWHGSSNRSWHRGSSSSRLGNDSGRSGATSSDPGRSSSCSRSSSGGDVSIDEIRLGSTTGGGSGGTQTGGSPTGNGTVRRRKKKKKKTGRRADASRAAKAYFQAKAAWEAARAAARTGGGKSQDN